MYRRRNKNLARAGIKNTKGDEFPIVHERRRFWAHFASGFTAGWLSQLAAMWTYDQGGWIWGLALGLMVALASSL